MVVCELDSEVSGEILGWKLPAWQAILLHRVLPSCGGLVVYLCVIGYDLALIYEHFVDDDKGVAVVSIVLMILPALLALVFTLASPPPGLQTEDSAYKVQIHKNDLCWIFQQFLNCLLFPIAAIGRYCHQIFWWTEVVFASSVDDGERVNDALSRASAPSSLELYLFLQAFIHSAPLAIVNVIQMMSRTENPSYDKITVQSISIIAASLRMASTATVYRRFEREKLCGRKYPWNTNSAELDNSANERLEKEQEENIYEAVLPENRQSASPLMKGKRKYNSDLIQFSPSVREDQFSYDSAKDSNFKFPSPHPHVPRSNSDSDEEYMSPRSIVDRVAPRRSTQYTIENVEVVPPPIMPAPRMTLGLWADKMVENVESIPTWLSAPPRRRIHQEVLLEEPDIPKRVPRKYMRGLEPQDATAALVNFLGWYMFFIARLLSIAALTVFYPVISVVVLITHYQIVVLLLIVPPASSDRRCFYIFLAFIYLFCLMEFKIRFRHVRAWHVFWIIVMSLETVVFSSLWATIENPSSSWWKQYVLLTIFGSMLLSYMCMIVYFVILKPKETIVYIEQK